MKDVFFKQSQVCRLLNITVQAIRNWRAAGLNVLVKGPREVLINLAELRDFLAAKPGNDRRRTYYIDTLTKLLDIKRAEGK